LGAVETLAVIDRIEQASQALAQFKITQAVSIGGEAAHNLLVL
jgi:hypothetical protein